MLRAKEKEFPFWPNYMMQILAVLQRALYNGINYKKKENISTVCLIRQSILKKAMRKRFSQILLPVVVLGMCLCLASIALAGEATPACQTVSQDFRSSPFHTTNPLGIAGNFHLVGFSSVTTTAHTNGNILTDTLRYQNNFGTKGVDEVSYIRKIEFLSGGDGFSSTYSSTDSLLVVGPGVQVDTADNGNAWSLNGHKVDHPSQRNYPNNLMQDSDTLEYIDLEAVHDQTVRINQTLSTYENRLDKVIEQTDGEGTFIQKVILSDPAGVNVCNITDAHAFKEGTSIECKDFDSQRPGLLILNVDLAGVEEFLLPGTDLLYADGSRAPNGEVTEWQPGNVLWNLYDSSAKDGLYRGKVRNERPVAAHILAPEADVTLGVNLNGTVIARNIDVRGESHRTDLTMYSIDPGGDTMEIHVGKYWQSDETFEVEAVLICTDAQGHQTECASLPLNESNGWRDVFKNIKKYDENGDAYHYQVKECIGGLMYGNGDELIYGRETYIVSIQDAPEIGFRITNCHQGGSTPGPETLSVSVEKRWDLRAAGLAPYPVTVRLYQNGVGMADRTLTLGEDAWSGCFEDLPMKDADGQPYEYTIREIINGRPHGDGDEFAYGETHTAVSVAGSQQEGYVVTNTLWKAGLVAVPVYKTWDLGPGMSGYPVAFELYRHVQGEDASGAVRVENPVCDYGGPYQVEFRDLPKYDGAGRSYVYTVREVVGGESYTDGDVFASPGGGTTAVSIAPAESGGYVVRNVVRRDGELLSIPVRKVWRGGAGAGVTVQLYRGTDGSEKMEGCVLLLGEHNGWEGVFENLQRHDAAGRACTYTVREVVEGVSYGDGDRFVAGGALIRLSIEGDETSGFTVINTVESTKGPPVTGVTSPAALAGAGLLASVAGMSAAWLALRRRRRGEEKPGN